MPAAPRNMIGQWHIPQAPQRKGVLHEVEFVRDADIHGRHHVLGGRYRCSCYLADRLVEIGAAVRVDHAASLPPEPPFPPPPSRPTDVEAQDGGDLSSGRRGKRRRWRSDDRR